MSNSSTARIVYVVDEDASVREGLARLMDAWGFDVAPCASVSEFLRCADGGRNACVLLDLSAMRRCEPSLQSVVRAIAGLLPVIALTKSDASVTRRYAREVGARSCFRTPVDASALLDAIEWSLPARD